MSVLVSVETAPLEIRSASTLAAAVTLFRARELAEARALCEALIEDHPPAPDGPDDAAALRACAAYWAARSARRQERPDDALRFLYAGLVDARRAADGRCECLLRAELVHVMSALGQNDEALEQADATLQRARHLGDAVGNAAAQEALASIYWMTEEWELAHPAYEAALELATACDHLELQVLATLGRAASEEGVAGVHRAAGRLAEADAMVWRSVGLQREAGVLAAALKDDYLVMYSELNCGCSLHSMGAYDEARAVFRRCIADPTRAAVHGNAWTQLGRIEFDEGRPADALACLQRALPLTEVNHKPYPVLVVLDGLVNAHEALGDAASALAFLRRYHTLYVKNATDKARMRAQAMAVKYETEKARAVAEAQRQRADRLERSHADLLCETAQLARDSLEDALTGVANRRHFDRALKALARTSADGGGLTPCSVALLDIDHFKHINDRHSHLVGDEVLRRLGPLLAAACRRGDLVARYGGEEFVLLSGELDRDAMRQVCERIRREVELADWSSLRPGLAVTVSIGVADHREVPERGEGAGAALMALADARLYAAKHGGRNRVFDGRPGECANGGAHDGMLSARAA